MSIMNDILEFFGVLEIAEQATFQDLMVYGLSVILGVYVFVCIYRGIVTLCFSVGKDW